MADKPKPPEVDWSEVTGQAVERLRAPKVAPVPEHIVKAAQRSYDGVKQGDKVLHALRHEFKDEQTAALFAKLVKKAQDHTVPRSTVRVVIDPDHGEPNHTCNKRVVAWEASKKRQRTTSGT